MFGNRDLCLKVRSYAYDHASASGSERRRRSLDSGRGGSGSGSPRGRKDSINSQGSQGSPRNAGSPSLQVYPAIWVVLSMLVHVTWVHRLCQKPLLLPFFQAMVTFKWLCGWWVTSCLTEIFCSNPTPAFLSPQRAYFFNSSMIKPPFHIPLIHLFRLSFSSVSILFCSHLAPFSVSFMGQLPCDWWWVVSRLYPVIITRFMANRVPKIRPTSLMNNKDCREIRVDFHLLSAFLPVKSHVFSIHGICWNLQKLKSAREFEYAVPSTKVLRPSVDRGGSGAFSVRQLQNTKSPL
jgi:hypothetical protein